MSKVGEKGLLEPEQTIARIRSSTFSGPFVAAKSRYALQSGYTGLCGGKGQVKM